jgi:hypothetical protein
MGWWWSSRNDGNIRNPMKWYRYKREEIVEAVGPAVVAILAPAIPLLFAGLLQLAFIGHVALDLGRLSTGLQIGTALGWLFLMAACVPRGYFFCQRFGLSDDAVARTVFGFQSKVDWDALTAVEKRIEPTYRPPRWIDEERLVLRSQSRSFVIYDKLHSYEELKAIVSKRCREFRKPQMWIDKRFDTLARLKSENLALYRTIRRTGVRTIVSEL